MRKIPNYLDDPQQMLVWEFDEFILLAFAFGLGILTNHLGVLLIAGLVGVKYYRKIKDRQANGFLIHLVYWHSGAGSSKTYPTSKPLAFIRRFF